MPENYVIAFGYNGRVYEGFVYGVDYVPPYDGIPDSFARFWQLGLFKFDGVPLSAVFTNDPKMPNVVLTGIGTFADATTAPLQASVKFTATLRCDKATVKAGWTGWSYLDILIVDSASDKVYLEPKGVRLPGLTLYIDGANQAVGKHVG